MILILGLGVPTMAKPTFQEGGMLPEFKLSIPSNEDQKKYLGLSGDGHFELSDIDAEVVIIEIFSMYCPHCQREAHKVNKLYDLIEENKKLKEKIKLIGIGAGNSSFEVEIFRKTYRVPFPLFADADFTIHKALGEVRTPYFIGITLNRDGSHKIFFSELGGFESAEEFLQSVLKRSGLKSQE